MSARETTLSLRDLARVIPRGTTVSLGDLAHVFHLRRAHIRRGVVRLIALGIVSKPKADAYQVTGDTALVPDETLPSDPPRGTKEKDESNEDNGAGAAKKPRKSEPSFCPPMPDCYVAVTQEVCGHTIHTYARKPVERNDAALTLVRTVEGALAKSAIAYFNAACDRADAVIAGIADATDAHKRTAMAFEMTCLRDAADLIERRLATAAGAA